jgi:putative FmdB family regulatory protein
VISKSKENELMPIYDYQCVDCGEQDKRVAGADDHTALCVACGGLMLRLDGDAWQGYFPELAAGGDARPTNPTKTP